MEQPNSRIQVEQLGEPSNVPQVEQPSEPSNVTQTEQPGEPGGAVLVQTFSASKGMGSREKPSEHDRNVTLIRWVVLSTVVIMGLIPFVAILLVVLSPVLNPGSMDLDATHLPSLSVACFFFLYKLDKEMVMSVLAFAIVYFGLMGRLWGFLQQRLSGRGEYYRSAIYLICLCCAQWFFKTVLLSFLGRPLESAFKGAMGSAGGNFWIFFKLMCSIFLIKKVGSRNFLLAYGPLCLALVILRDFITMHSSIDGNVPDMPKYAAVRKMASEHGLDPKRLFKGSPSKPFEEDDGEQENYSDTNASYAGTLWFEAIMFRGQFFELPEDVQLSIMAHELGHRKFYDFLQGMAIALISDWVYWLAALQLALPHESVFAAFGFAVEPMVGAITIAQFSVNVLKPVRKLISHSLDQYMEYRADAHAVSIGHGAGLVKYFSRPGNDVYDIHPFYSLLTRTHPTHRRRIRHIETLMNKSQLQLV